MAPASLKKRVNAHCGHHNFHSHKTSRARNVVGEKASITPHYAKLSSFQNRDVLLLNLLGRYVFVLNLLEHTNYNLWLLENMEKTLSDQKETETLLQHQNEVGMIVEQHCHL